MFLNIKNRMFNFEDWFPKSVFVFCLLSFVLWLSCGKNSTSPETVTFSGKVTLEGETDHSGVTVSLYKPVELDTALVRINRQYPNIGVQISQETEFDHREHTPVYSTTTDANGNWKIENVVAGEYNVVASKEGYGWRYVLDEQVNGDEVLKFITLKEKIILNQPVYSEYTFQSGRIYEISNAVIINNPVFQTEVDLHLNGTLKLKGTGNNTLGLNKIRVNGSGVNARLDIENFGAVTINESNFANLPGGIRIINGLGATITKVVIKNGIEVLYCNQLQELTIENCIFYQHDRSIEIWGSNNFKFRNNLVYRLNEGLKIYDSNSEITGTYFKEGKNALIIYSENKLTLENNQFDYLENFSIGLFGCVANVKKNKFNGSTTYFVVCNSEYVHQFFRQPTVTIKQNNFFVKQTTVALTLGRISGVPVDNSTCTVDVDAKQNFWNFTTEPLIENAIYDKLDNPSLGEVDHTLFLQTPIIDAGIIN